MSEGIKRGSEMVCTFQCNDVMEFTVTRTAVHVLTLLGDTFNAARKTLVTKKEISTAPYLINNDTGMEIIVSLKIKSCKMVLKMYKIISKCLGGFE